MITLLLAALLLTSPAQLTEHHADHSLSHPVIRVDLSRAEMKAELAAYTESTKTTGMIYGNSPLAREDNKIINNHFPPGLKRATCKFKHSSSIPVPGYMGKVYYAVVVYSWGYPTCELWA